MASNLQKLRILILGRGFIGLRLAQHFRKTDHEVFTFSRSPSMDASFRTTRDWTGDFARLDASDLLFQAPFDLIFHAISTTTPSSSDMDPSFDILSYLLGTVEFIKKLPSPEKTKLVFISSAGTVYGPSSELMNETSPTDPICSYGITKLAIEKHLSIAHKNTGLDYLILRVSNPYGSWAHGQQPFGIINRFVDNLILGKNVTIYGELDTERDFIFIDDLIAAIQLASFSQTGKKIYNVSYGKSYSLQKILVILKSEFNEHLLVEHLPAREFDLKRVRIDNSLFVREFNWEPKQDLHHGIKLLIQARKSV